MYDRRKDSRDNNDHVHDHTDHDRAHRISRQLEGMIRKGLFADLGLGSEKEGVLWVSMAMMLMIIMLIMIMLMIMVSRDDG